MKIVAHVAALLSLVAIAAVVLALRSSAADGQSEPRILSADGKLEAVVDAQGHLHVPSSYRAAYEFLGTWAIAADKAVGSSEIHNVYVTPGTIAVYHTSGHFPDGTVLIKEVYETSTAPMTTGTVSHAGLEGLVRHGEGQQRQSPWQLAVGGWLGVVVVRCGKSHDDNLDPLQNKLSFLPRARQSNGLGLYVRVSNPQVGDRT
jgi:hypothetical protein